MKKLRFVGIAVLVLTVGAAVWWRRDAGPIRTVTLVERGPVAETIVEPGRTRLPETFPITMPFAGRLKMLTLREGDAVQKGQVVAELDRFALENALEEGEARVARLAASIVENDDERMERTSLKATDPVLESMTRMVEAAREKANASLARWDFSKMEGKRAKELFQKDSASRAAWDAAELLMLESASTYQSDLIIWRASQALREAVGFLPVMLRQTIEKKGLSRAVLIQEQAEARARVASLRHDLARTALTSPVDGVVLQRSVMGLQPLPANTLIMEIGRLDDLEIETDLLTQDALKIRPGASAVILGTPDGPIPAVVSRIFPRGFTKISSLGVEQQRVKVILTPAPTPADRTRIHQSGRVLGAEYRIETAINVAHNANALRIPRSAAFRDAQGVWHAFRIDNDRARLVTIVTGIVTPDLLEIRSGLAEGDTVILAPDPELADGAVVVTATVPFPNIESYADINKNK